MIPVRFFAESVGLQVQWDGPTQTVYLGSRGDAPPDRSSTAGRTVSLLLESATSLIGTPYKWGGISPTSGFDCSGFVQYLLGQRGVKLPRTSQEQYKAGIPVSRSELQAGDLVFFETYAAGATHVGIADGKGNFVHAGSEKTGVLTTPLSNSWWAARYLGARRVLR